MKPSFRRLRMALSLPRLLPHLAILCFLRRRRDASIVADLLRWADIYRLPPPSGGIGLAGAFVALMTFAPEFRNLFYLRAGWTGRLVAWLAPPLDTLQIDCADVGPGLFIQHGVATLISAERIGANCWINQHVVVGFSNDTSRPRIGDNVRIAPGAKVIGGVTIGDGATIGPNTVIFDDVAPGVTMLGVPGRAIWGGGARSR